MNDGPDFWQQQECELHQQWIEEQTEMTAERLRELLHYDPDTGVFTWLVSPAENVRAGAVAGCIARTGYRLIVLFKRQYRAHRLAWLYVHGTTPTHQIDHVNGDRADNRLANLRLATNAQNSVNVGLRSDNTSGFKGVSLFTKTGKWKAQATVSGRSKHIGYFNTPEDAADAYLNFVRPHHGEFFRNG